MKLASYLRRSVSGAAAALLVLVAAGASAHEVRPAYLYLHEENPTTFEVLWKQPLLGDRRLPLEPRYPEDCSAEASAIDAVQGGALIQRFVLTCESDLGNRAVSVDGLSRTITDVMVRATFADGSVFSAIVKPQDPTVVLDRSGVGNVIEYLVLGIEHLLLGFDHILFVIGLMFFLTRFGPLLKAITAFTVAHSVTLALAALDLVRVPQAPVEAVIALSIVFLSVEKLRGVEDSLTVRYTWVVAFVFGLLHGFGFAGVLQDIGLPRDALLASLFLFNLGVEIGQILVVLIALAIAWAVRRLFVETPAWVIRTPLYASGVMASYWLVERTAGILAIA